MWLNSHDRKWLNFKRPLTGVLYDEPDEDAIKVLSIKLSIDNDLTPEWSVITNREPLGKNISYRNRQRFGVTRIGGTIDDQLAWISEYSSILQKDM